MKQEDARKILGIHPDDDPRAFLADFETTLEHKRLIAEQAPDKKTKQRYSRAFLDYQDAIQTILPKKRYLPHTDFLIVLLLIATLSILGWWAFKDYWQDWYAQQTLSLSIGRIDAQAKAAIAQKNFDKAQALYNRIESLAPHSPLLLAGRKQLALQQQSLGNWQKEDKKQWESSSQQAQDITILLNKIWQALHDKDANRAENNLAQLRSLAPNHPLIPELSVQLDKLNTQQLKALAAKKQQAQQLYEQALQRDTGNFDKQALLLLEQALALDSTHAKAIKLLKKMQAYIQIIHVPKDYPSLQLAIDSAQAKAHIIVAPGSYQESIILNKPLTIQGSNSQEKTRFTLPAQSAPLLTVLPAAQGSSLSHIHWSHEGYDYDPTERFCAVLITSPEITMLHCSIKNAAGHGIVIEKGGGLTLQDSLVSGCGWNGISVEGQDSYIALSQSHLIENFHHGIAFSQEGSGSIEKTLCEKNGLCGLFAQSGNIQVEFSSFISNHEAGIYATQTARIAIRASKAQSNQLSGMALCGKQLRCFLSKNRSSGNEECGFLFLEGAIPTLFEDNKAEKNTLAPIQGFTP